MTNAPAIFVVEDEAIISMELRDRLRGLGYVVSGHAARGEQALAEIDRQRADLVLMDIRLGGELNGIETASRLREQHALPVIFLTAYSDSELLLQAGEAQPFGFLVKPIEERELHATIQMALFKHAMEKQLLEKNRQLEEALVGVKRLQGLIPICMECKKIRDSRDYWHRLESYLHEHAGVIFSHGLCPTCLESQLQSLADAETEQ